MKNKQPPFQFTNKIIDDVAEISELTGRLSAHDHLSGNPNLRRTNRIRTIHGSLAIEQKDYHAALGWATCETASLRMENLLRIAETRMYQAKSAYYQDKNILPRGR